MSEYRYYAIRVGPSIIFRKTVKGLKRVVGKIRNSAKRICITQTTYTGGIVVGTMDYNVWYKKTRITIEENQLIKTDRQQVKGLSPFIIASKTNVKD